MTQAIAKNGAPGFDHLQVGTDTGTFLVAQMKKWMQIHQDSLGLHLLDPGFGADIQQVIGKLKEQEPTPVPMTIVLPWRTSSAR